MTVIGEIYLHPVKGCRGIPLRTAQVAQTGLELDGIGDREWVVVDEHGEFLSQRELPRMALIETRFAAGSLRLKAPGMLALDVPFASEGDVVQVQVWNDRLSAVTQGEIADAWFTKFLGTSARLMRFDPEGRRVANRAYTGGAESPYKFADAFALLVTNRASLADLNAKLQRQRHAPVDMRRFRPNLVLDDLPEYEEDYVKSLRIGNVELRVVKPCARCTVPGVDPDSGVAATTVPDVLSTYRQTENGVLFGVNAIVVNGADDELHIGQTVDVELNL